MESRYEIIGAFVGIRSEEFIKIRQEIGNKLKEKSKRINDQLPGFSMSGNIRSVNITQTDADGSGFIVTVTNLDGSGVIVYTNGAKDIVSKEIDLLTSQ